MFLLLSIGLLMGWPGVALPITDAGALVATGHRTWSWDLTSGFDSYLHSYALATDDTTETLAEFMFQAGLHGRSSRSSRHRWHLWPT